MFFIKISESFSIKKSSSVYIHTKNSYCLIAINDTVSFSFICNEKTIDCLKFDDSWLLEKMDFFTVFRFSINYCHIPFCREKGKIYFFFINLVVWYSMGMTSSAVSQPIISSVKIHCFQLTFLKNCLCKKNNNNRNH